MREIKFRAWDKDNNKMFYWDIKNFDAKHSSHYDNIMQYTGLFDRNGVEIYSGDIIRDERGEIGVIVDFDYGQQYMWLNEYRDWIKGVQVVIADAVGDMQTASWLGGNEIIGNIYEHPHLLNKD